MTQMDAEINSQRRPGQQLTANVTEAAGGSNVALLPEERPEGGAVYIWIRRCYCVSKKKTKVS